jgi:hypothetical protein
MISLSSTLARMERLPTAMRIVHCFQPASTAPFTRVSFSGMSLPSMSATPDCFSAAGAGEAALQQVSLHIAFGVVHGDGVAKRHRITPER